MFTGIIEAMRPIVALQRGAQWRITIDLGSLAEDAKLGDSIAINGVCLTISALEGSQASFDAIGETMGRTALSTLAVGSQVNTERALRVGDRMGGHFVAGHVDGVGTLRGKDERRDQVVVTVGVEPALTRYMAAKASVAIDGISLTLVDVGADWFSVAVIPFTLAETTLGVKRPGEPVNVEVDLLARYVEKMVGSGPGLTEDTLRRHGFA